METSPPPSLSLWNENPMDVIYPVFDHATDFNLPLISHNQADNGVQKADQFDDPERTQSVCGSRDNTSPASEQEHRNDHCVTSNLQPLVDTGLLMAAIIKHLESEAFNGELDTLVKQEYRFFEMKLAQLGVVARNPQANNIE